MTDFRQTALEQRIKYLIEMGGVYPPERPGWCAKATLLAVAANTLAVVAVVIYLLLK